MDTQKLQEQENNEINLGDLFSHFRKYLRRFWLIVLLTGIACAAIFAAVSYVTFTPVYEAKAMFTVSADSTSSNIATSGDYYYNNTAAQQLTAAFPYILQADVMRDLIKQELGTSTINGIITAESVVDTNLFTLTVRSSKPQDAYNILMAVIHNYPQVASYMVDYSHVVMQREPTVPTRPVSTYSWKRPVLYGFLLGAAVCILVLLVASLLRKTISTTEDLKAGTNLPILASIPETPVKQRRKGTGTLSILRPETDQQLLSAFRGLRVKLLREIDPQHGKIILVTSTIPGEGKTTISMNLALALASNGARVLLLDADLRKQDLAVELEAEEKPGLTSYFTRDDLEPDACIAEVSGTTLKLVSNHGETENPAVLNPHKFRAFLRTLKPRFDYIVVDTPPCGIISDARFITRDADSILYVVRRDFAERGQILDCLHALAAENDHLTGCVFNGTPHTGSSYGYGYGYGKYGYGSSKYGYGVKKPAAEESER